MIFLTRKFIKYLIILFLASLQIDICVGLDNKKILNDKELLVFSCNDLRSRVQEIVHRIELAKSEKEEDVILQELCVVVADFYKKVVEISALYLSGYSDALYKKLLFDVTRDLFVIGKLLLIYVPRMIKDSRVPWKIKMRKCLYATGVMAVTALWIKEMYKHKIKDDFVSRPSMFGKRSGVDSGAACDDKSDDSDRWMMFQ